MTSRLFKEKRSERKRQLKINAQLKKRLFGNLFVAPCYYCRLVFLKDELTIEHIIPLSIGGTNDDNNIALACAPCNHQRGRETWLLKKKILRKQYEQHSSEHC